MLPSLLTLTLILLFALPLCYSHTNSAGFCTQQSDLPMAAATLGGLRDSNADLDSLARFAVDHHNNKENALLQLVRVVKAEEQVVAGTLHHLTLEVLDAGKKKLYEAKIWVKPWMDFKEVQEFKHVGDADTPPFTNSDLGAKKEADRCSGWQSIPVHDPLVKAAADHAVQTIKQRSNSLLPYELSEVVLANAEVVDDSAANIDMVLKLKRGEKEEKMKVVVHRNAEGNYHLNHMEPHN